MSLGLASLLGETRLIGEFLTFAGDALLDRPASPGLAAKPVLLIPGLMAGDATLYPLGARLRAAGHRVFFAGIWCNSACPAATLERLEKRLRAAHEATGAKVVVIGHSLGGIYTRMLARRCPALFERAILLGAPLRRVFASLNPWARGLQDFIQVAHSCCAAAVLGEAISELELPPAPPEVAETIVYSRSDGMVNWRTCIQRGANVETLEVTSSHCGMPLNLDVWRLISERLSDRQPAAAAAVKAPKSARVTPLFR